MSRYGGLQLDEHRLRLAIFEGSPKSYALVDYLDEEISADSPDEKKEVIRGLLSEVLARKENRGLEVVSSLDSRRAILREISIPYTREDLIAKTIRFEAESYIHAQSIDNLIIEYLKSGEGDNSSRLVLCAMAKDGVRTHLETLQGAHVDPLIVELDATALASAFAATPLYNGEQNVLLIELDDDATRLVFLEKNRVVKIRAVWSRPTAAPGSSSPATAVSREETAGDRGVERRFEEIEKSLMKLDETSDLDGAVGGNGSEQDDLPFVVVPDEDYETLFTASGAPTSRAEQGRSGTDAESAAARAVSTTEPVPAVGASGAMTVYRDDPVARLFLEIERTFAAYVLNNSIDLMVVTGGRAGELEAVDRLAEYFEVDVVPFDFGDSFSVAWEGDTRVLSEHGAVACGLALRALGRGITAVDLRKEEFRFERRFEKLIPSLTVLGMLLCVLAFVWSFKHHKASESLQLEVLKLRENQARVFENFFTAKPRVPPVNFAQAATVRLKELQQGGSKGTSGRQRSNLAIYRTGTEMFGDIINAVARSGGGKPDQRVAPEFRNFDFKPQAKKNVKSMVDLEVKTRDEALRVISAIKDHSQLFDVVDQLLPDDKKGTFMVKLTLELKSSVLESTAR